MKGYTVKYVMSATEAEREISFLARTAADAYDKAVYEMIPAQEGSMPYGAYVYSVTYNNGNYHRFSKNMIGKPY